MFKEETLVKQLQNIAKKDDILSFSIFYDLEYHKYFIVQLPDEQDINEFEEVNHVYYVGNCAGCLGFIHLITLSEVLYTYLSRLTKKFQFEFHIQLRDTSNNLIKQNYKSEG